MADANKPANCKPRNMVHVSVYLQSWCYSNRCIHTFYYNNLLINYLSCTCKLTLFISTDSLIVFSLHHEFMSPYNNKPHEPTLQSFWFCKRELHWICIFFYLYQHRGVPFIIEIHLIVIHVCFTCSLFTQWFMSVNYGLLLSDEHYIVFDCLLVSYNAMFCV